ncbi:MAG: HAMP domain-containing histidine kinase [Gemmatimonadales bacterium]|nr:HAMP domain-containing histidine kinase [Gemmatimonadales bacterium]
MDRATPSWYLAAPPDPLEAYAEMPDDSPLSHIELLAQANRAAVLEPVLRWLLHDMRNPVQALCMLTELAAEPNERATQVNLTEALSEFCRRISGDLGLIARLLRPLPEAPSPAPISIADSVRFVAELVGKHHGAPRLDPSPVLAAALPAARGTQEHLDLALLSLVVNSIEGQGKRSGWIRLTATSDTSTLRLQVQDDAPRLSPAVMAELLADSTTSAPNPSPSGLRLIAARSLVRRWGGELRAEETAEGNRFDLIVQVWPRPPG